MEHKSMDFKILRNTLPNFRAILNTVSRHLTDLKHLEHLRQILQRWWFRFPQPRWGSLCQLGSVTIDRGLGRTRKTTRESEMLMFCNRRSRKGGVV